MLIIVTELKINGFTIKELQMKRVIQIIVLLIIGFCVLSCSTTQNNSKKLSRLNFPITVLKGEITINVSGYIDTKGILFAVFLKNKGLLPADYDKYDNDKVFIKTINETRTLREDEVFRYSLSTDEVVSVNIISANGKPATIICSNNLYEINEDNKYGINLLFKQKN